MLTACGGADSHTHEFKTGNDWSSDSLYHWHAATCEHATEKGDVALHADANKDGVCDTCAWVLCEHTFETEYSYDATNHWYDATCIHDVVSGKEAHTYENGVCSDCGYVTTAPAATVAEAIARGVANKGEVYAGVMSSDAGYGAEETYYEYRDGYLYVKTNSGESYYSKTENGVFAVSKWFDAYEGVMVTEKIEGATEDSLNGPSVPNSFIYGDYDFYGAEGLVAELYEVASENVNGDFTESVEDGVYKFSFGYYAGWAGIYVIEAEFTLSENGFIDNVTVVSNNYDAEENTPATETEDATYKVMEGGMLYATYTVELNQGASSIENPFDASALLATDFVLANSWGEEVTDITIEQGYAANFYFASVLPETAVIGMSTVSFDGENVNTEEYDPDTFKPLGLSADYFAGNDYITLKSSDAVETAYELAVTVNGVTKTYNVTVVAAEPSMMTVGYLQMNEETYSNEFHYGSWFDIYAGENVNVAGMLDKDDGGYTVTINGEAVAEEDLMTDSLWMDDLGTYVDVVYVSTAFLPAGEYEIVFASAANADVFGSATVTVNALPTLESALNGLYTYYVYESSTMWGETVYTKISLELVADYIEEENDYAQGSAVLTTSTVMENWSGMFEDEESKVIVNAYYNYEAGAFTFISRFGQPMDLGYVFRLNASKELEIGMVEVEYDAMNKEEVVEPVAAELVLGNNQIEGADVSWTYTATENGTLSLSLSNAIMGAVSVTYTVNGEDAGAIEAAPGTAEIALNAGDVVVINVTAAGYATLAASWNA